MSDKVKVGNVTVFNHAENGSVNLVIQIKGDTYFSVMVKGGELDASHSKSAESLMLATKRLVDFISYSKG